MLAEDSVCAPLPWSQCRFATLLDARPRGPIAQGDPGRSMREFERAAKKRCHSSLHFGAPDLPLEEMARTASGYIQKLVWHWQNNPVI